MAEKDSSSGFIFGFIVGASICLAMGLFYAPQPGKETRELIKEKAEDLKVKASEVADKVKETAAEAKAKAQVKLEEMRGKPEESHEAA